MTPKRDPSQILQVGFTVLFVVLVVLASYWIYDHVHYTQQMRDQLAMLYDPQTDSAIIAQLSEEAGMRINRVIWEGAFFLIVLLSGLIVLTRTIRHDAALRQRQQNFLAAVSHEFKSPLASIRLAAETLLVRSEAVETQRIARRILTDDERLLRMVENLLDTTRIEEGRHPFKPETVDLAGVIATVLENCRDRCEHHGIAVHSELPASLPVVIDPVALEGILRNIIDNAINASVAGHGGDIRIAVSDEQTGVTLAVEDSGVGFPPDEAEMIFEKFYRAGDEMRRTTPGSGLGLYIVRRLATLSGARVTAASAGPGKGARFTLHLPSGSTA